MNWKLFSSTFALVFVAELPDKTAFATLLMATRGNPLALFIGVALAFVVQSLIAVSFGSLLSGFPPRWIHLGAGLLFFVFAFLALRRPDEEADEDGIKAKISSRADFWKTARKSFVVIFLAEWGDLTQLASASLAARFRAPLTIFSASVLALWSVTGLAIFAGHHLRKAIQPVLLNRIAAAAFFAVGCFMVADWFRG